MCCKHCANNEKNNTGCIRKGRTTRTVKNQVQHENINCNQESGKFQQHMRQNGANNMEIKTNFKMLHASEQQGKRDQEKQPETPRKTRTWNSKGKSNKKRKLISKKHRSRVQATFRLVGPEAARGLWPGHCWSRAFARLAAREQWGQLQGPTWCLPDITTRYPCRVTFVIWHIWIYCLDICMDFERLSLGQNSKGNHPHILVFSWEFTLNQQQSTMNALNRWPTTTCIGFGLNSMQPKQQSQSLTKKEVETKERDGFP